MLLMGGSFLFKGVFLDNGVFSCKEGLEDTRLLAGCACRHQSRSLVGKERDRGLILNVYLPALTTTILLLGQLPHHNQLSILVSSTSHCSQTSMSSLGRSRDDPILFLLIFSTEDDTHTPFWGVRHQLLNEGGTCVEFIPQLRQGRSFRLLKRLF